MSEILSPFHFPPRPAAQTLLHHDVTVPLQKYTRLQSVSANDGNVKASIDCHTVPSENRIVISA